MAFESDNECFDIQREEESFFSLVLPSWTKVLNFLRMIFAFCNIISALFMQLGNIILALMVFISGATIVVLTKIILSCPKEENPKENEQ